jgi:hypothetical protein
MRLHSSLRGAERRRGLRDREIQIEPQHDHLTLAIRQTTNSPAHHIALRKPLGLIEVNITTIIGSKPLADTPTLTAPTITRQIHKHPVRVRVRRLTRQDPPLRRPPKRHLEQILRMPAIPTQQEGASQQRRRRAPRERLKLATISVAAEPVAATHNTHNSNRASQVVTTPKISSGRRRISPPPVAQILFSEPARPR